MPRKGEQEGRDYDFQRKEDILDKIRDGQMIEWGELDGQLYGSYKTLIIIIELYLKEHPQNQYEM